MHSLSTIIALNSYPYAKSETYAVDGQLLRVVGKAGGTVIFRRLAPFSDDSTLTYTLHYLATANVKVVHRFA